MGFPAGVSENSFIPTSVTQGAVRLEKKLLLDKVNTGSDRSPPTAMSVLYWHPQISMQLATTNEFENHFIISTRHGGTGATSSKRGHGPFYLSRAWSAPLDLT
jgi:hypothetical protein